LVENELEKLPSLQTIAVAATGYDRIDVAACREFGVTVSNLRGWCDKSVAEHVFALALALRRNLMQQREIVFGGTWQRSAAGSLLLTRASKDLRGATMGIVGFGRIGERVADLARGFGMRVLVSERKGATAVSSGRVEFGSLLEQSDVVSLHCPLNAETRRLIGPEELRRMKSDAILINCARGEIEIVDSTALSAALAGGVIAGAGLDGLEIEPPSPGNPLLGVDLPNLVITPHVAWASEQAIDELRRQLLENIEAFARGAPQNVVG
jgi:glycerate dehydrogenase